MTTILVLDDNALELQWIGNSVQSAGWSVVFADNGMKRSRRSARQFRTLP